MVDCICVPVFQQDSIHPEMFWKVAGFAGSAGQVLLVDRSAGPQLLVGFGPLSAVTNGVIREAAAAAGAALHHLETISWDLQSVPPLPINSDELVKSLAEGSVLGSHQPRGGAQPTWALPPGAAADPWFLGQKIAEAVILVRDLVNSPPNILGPSAFARRCMEVGENSGLQVTVRNRADCEQLGLGGLLAIGRGSAEQPVLIELSRQCERGRPALSLVGKGVTFDSGGLSLKSPEGMIGMKHDMAGAATVLGAMSLLRDVAPDLPVRGFLAVVENMPGPNSARPGDVVTTRNGLTVEILNTDFEGRVILADALALASEESPRAIIDIATLTHAAVNALGERTAALFGNDPALSARIVAASGAADEPIWPLPTPPYLRTQLLSDIADLKNYPGVPTARALTAAMFLSEFVPEEIPWAHLDIAGPAWAHEPYGLTPRGGTGFAVRLLTELFQQSTVPEEINPLGDR